MRKIRLRHVRGLIEMSAWKLGGCAMRTVRVSNQGEFSRADIACCERWNVPIEERGRGGEAASERYVGETCEYMYL